ncbi:hypothetical protein J2Z42_000851 [Clostridium algifaecis]|uniref:Uncharacterized protein n=1 Tax=Clostridium algifaecis TaxID=1472040 RepID=A0ABS4KRR5_9CLOT|nr:hypothetical protein [Clostridium algifaecis]
MNNIILNHDRVNFNEIEKVVFGIVCEAGLSIVKGLMENLDEELFNSRDKKKYRYKFKTQKTIQTVMGDLTFQRRYYIDKHTREGICLLDNILDLDTIGRTSLNLVERIIDNAVDNSYRESARKIENTTVTKVSHQTIKNKVDFVGTAIEKLENVRVEKYLNNELKGEKESKIHFEEKDGVFLRIQG